MYNFMSVTVLGLSLDIIVQDLFFFPLLFSSPHPFQFQYCLVYRLSVICVESLFGSVCLSILIRMELDDTRVCTHNRY